VVCVTVIISDNGITFDGRAAFVIDLAGILYRYVLPAKRGRDNFNFAFSTKPGGIAQRQYLAVIYLKNEQ
jgi:hypothetical protein